MSEGEDGPTGDGGRVTRRGLLALAGASAVAGCAAIEGLAGGEPRIRAHELPDLDPDDEFVPPVRPSVPVEVAPAHFASARTRVTDLLAELPTPLGPAAIPNGYVRRQIQEAAAAATSGLDDALEAPTELVALRSLRRAREEARFAAAGWAFADRGLSVETLRREHRRAVSAAESAREAHEYRGATPVRAALVHARIEETLARAADDSVRGGAEGRLLTVAEWGRAAESARAHLEDARHLDEQFGASLPADAADVAGRLRGAAEQLLADVRARRRDLPPEPTAEEWDLPQIVVDDLRFEADSGVTRVDEAVGLASAVVDATEQLAQFRALDRVRERLASGDLSSPESAAAVRAARDGAYDALAAALAESPAPELARTVVTDVGWRVASADRELSRAEGTVSPARLDDVVADYAVATAVARATPAATRRTVEALGRE